MPTDTSISRVASDATSQVLRKKNNTDSIDVSKLSFFDELLSIGQFDASIPEPLDLPASTNLNDSNSSESKDSASDNNPDSRDKETDDSTQQPTSQPAVVLQPQHQAAIPEVQKSSRSDTNNTRSKVATDQSKDNGVANNNAKAVNDGLENAANQTAVPSSPQDSPFANASLSSEQQPVTAVDPDGKRPLGDANNASPTIANAEANHRERTPKTSGTNQVNDGKVNQGKTVVGKPESSSVKSRQEKPGAIPVSSLLQEDTHSQDNQPLENVPRNKRAERLSKIATNEEPSSSIAANEEESSASKDSAVDNSAEKSTVEPTSDSQFSVSTPPLTSSPVVSLSAASVSNAFTLSSSNAGATSNPTKSVEGNAATPAVRGNIPTGSTSVSNAVTSSSGSSPARADQGRSEVARSNSGTQITAYQEGKLVQRVLRGVEQLANGGGQVRLRLHPPELGSLQMSLRMEAGQVFAKLEVENSTAKEALLNNVQTLKDRMAEQGMTVAGFEVEVSTDSSGSGTGSSNLQNSNGSGPESRWENARSRFVQQNENRLSSEPVAAERKTATNWTRTNGSLDLTV